jgi:hypothetical protein
VFPGGYLTKDTNWINVATKGGNATFFGWRSPKDANGNILGYGVHSYGEMLSQSEGFSRCMVHRAFQQVCNRDFTSNEAPVVRDLASTFEKDGYNFKKLFQRVVTNQSCIGK